MSLMAILLPSPLSAQSDRQARLLAEADKYVAEVWAALEALGADLRGLREGLRGQVANDAERAR